MKIEKVPSYLPEFRWFFLQLFGNVFGLFGIFLFHFFEKQFLIREKSRPDPKIEREIFV
jgi:hypothetical protein